ncbi:HOAR [Perigonia lusca single nucleopolyhedrovirus]|uniref:HOAR n=1 Tax=Perigonia lusca single nucleopolyhedrovirus TaxID=1675865 RepID=A0A0M3WP86_9ABAC|nr:HOAR [Perigonia lusca single nucleopolyhedrovirus]AKN80618.1 HOAR [Perigonia lusca single nucleopolyhedrovirus]
MSSDEYKKIKLMYNDVECTVMIYLIDNRSGSSGKQVAYVNLKSKVFKLTNVTYKSRNNFTNRFEPLYENIQTVLEPGCNLRKRMEMYLTYITKLTVIDRIKECLRHYIAHYEPLITDEQTDPTQIIYEFVLSIKDLSKREMLVKSAQLYDKLSCYEKQFVVLSGGKEKIRTLLHLINKYVFSSMNTERATVCTKIDKLYNIVLPHLQSYQLQNIMDHCQKCQADYVYKILKCGHKMCLNCAYDSLFSCIVCVQRTKREKVKFLKRLCLNQPSETHTDVAITNDTEQPKTDDTVQPAEQISDANEPAQSQETTVMPSRRSSETNTVILENNKNDADNETDLVITKEELISCAENSEADSTNSQDLTEEERSEDEIANTDDERFIANKSSDSSDDDDDSSTSSESGSNESDRGSKTSKSHWQKILTKTIRRATSSSRSRSVSPEKQPARGRKRTRIISTKSSEQNSEDDGRATSRTSFRRSPLGSEDENETANKTANETAIETNNETANDNNNNNNITINPDINTLSSQTMHPPLQSASLSDSVVSSSHCNDPKSLPSASADPKSPLPVACNEITEYSIPSASITDPITSIPSTSTTTAATDPVLQSPSVDNQTNEITNINEYLKTISFDDNIILPNTELVNNNIIPCDKEMEMVNSLLDTLSKDVNNDSVYLVVNDAPLKQNSSVTQPPVEQTSSVTQPPVEQN